MKTFLQFIFMFFLFTNISSIYANALIEGKFQGHSIRIIEHDIENSDFTISIGIDEKGGSELVEIADNIGALTGINGVFECPKDYTECGGKNFTINERYIHGEKIGPYQSTGARAVFAWDKQYNAFLFRTDHINSSKEDDIWEGFANFPILLQDGESQIEAYVDLGLVDKKMTDKGRRSFICSNKSGSKIYFGHIENIGVDWMALLLKDFGCHNALNLDAGYSTAMIYNGKYIVGPGREILDGVFLVPNNFDIDLLNIKAGKLNKSIKKYLTNQTDLKRAKKLAKIQQALNIYSEQIYTKAESQYQINNEVIGKKYNIKSSKILKKLYLINKIRDEIKNL